MTEEPSPAQIDQRLSFMFTDETVAASVLCTTGESTLLFVPGSGAERPDALVIAHDDDLDGVYEDTDMYWFNVEESDVIEISRNLNDLAEKG